MRERRLDLGLTLGEAAGRLGVGLNTLWRWEVGHCRPYRRYAGALTRFLGEGKD